MPRIPVIDERSVLPGVSPIPSRQPLDQPGRARAVLGGAVEQGTNEMGQTLVRIGIERDDTAAREASVAANEELRVRYQREILTRQMGDATGAAEDTASLFDEVGRKHEDKLSPRQKELFSRHYQSNRPTYLDQATRHEIDQKALHQDFTRKRQAGSHIDNAELDVLNEATRERELTLGLRAIYTHQPMGTPREMIEAEAEAYRSLFHVRMATKLADDEPLQADAYLKQYAAEIQNDTVTQELRARIDRRTVNVQAQQEADALMAEHESSDDALAAARGIANTAVRDETEQRIRLYQGDEKRREAEALDTRRNTNEIKWRTFSRDKATGKLVLPPSDAIEWINSLPDLSEREKYFAEYDQLQAASTAAATAAGKAAATADARAQRATEAKQEQDAVWGRWNRLSKTEKLQVYKEDGLAKFGLVGDNHSKAITDVDGIRRGAKPKSREWATKVLGEAGITDDARVGRILGVWEEEIASLPGPEVGLPEQRALLLNLTRDDLELAPTPGGLNFFGGEGEDVGDLAEIAGDEDALSRVIIPRDEYAAVLAGIEAANAKLLKAGKLAVEPTPAHVRRIWMRQFFPSRDAETRALMGR